MSRPPMHFPSESVEWHVSDPTVPLCQGDILLSRDPTTRAIGTICTIITADCDITHRKFGSHLACLRLVPLKKYLRNYWAERKLRRVVETEIEKFQAKINKWHQTERPDAQPISQETIVSWVRECESDAICRDLRVPVADQPHAIEMIDQFRSFLEARSLSGTADAFAALVAVRVATSGKTQAACRDEAVKQAQGEPLPDDAFLLPELPQLEVGPVVVLLRELVAVPLHFVCYRIGEATTDSHFLRIGILRSTFKYAISQAFGNLYSRIGLPETYEKRCKYVIAELDQHI